MGVDFPEGEGPQEIGQLSLPLDRAGLLVVMAVIRTSHSVLNGLQFLAFCIYKYLLGILYDPDTVLDAKISAVTKQARSLPHGAYMW